jgi:cation transport ATPase
VLTGESRPVTLRCGDTVPAGAVPIGVALAGTALCASRNSALERLAALARSLSERPTRVLLWADRFAGALTPIVAVVAAITLVVRAHSTSLASGVLAALAVVLAACPCSYAIASPLVHWLVLRRAFRRGVLVRSADALEALAATHTVVFDKTGTLTRADLSVRAFSIEETESRERVLGSVRAMEDGNPHPVARALLRFAGDASVVAIDRRRIVAGKGVRAFDDRGREVSIGAGADGRIVFARDGRPIASFEIDEQPRPEAADAIRALRASGMRVLVLSGDTDARARRLGDALGIEAHGGFSPEEKLAFVESLGEGTAVVGDGINDAPALAARRTSFTLGEGAQLAKGVAQVTLLEPDLRLVAWTLALSRRAIRHVQWMLAISTAYNVVFVALAASGALRPVWAGLSMLVSSLLAVAFAARIGHDDDRQETHENEPASRAEVPSW